jgi:hypothetical protein
MAFGFEREPGTARGYINRSNPDFAIGKRLSRKRYDRYIDSIGQRRSELKEGSDALREAERVLEGIRARLADLAAREAALREREADLSEREAVLALREQEAGLARRVGRATAQGRGQRRYNAALSAYVETQRRRGHAINKKQAQASPEFKSIMKRIKGHANTRRNPHIADRNRFDRDMALRELGGDRFFRDQYESLYGGRSGGHGHRRLTVRRRRAA